MIMVVSEAPGFLTDKLKDSQQECDVQQCCEESKIQERLQSKDYWRF